MTHFIVRLFLPGVLKADQRSHDEKCVNWNEAAIRELLTIRAEAEIVRQFSEILIHQEVAGSAEIPIRHRPLRQEHATAATAIHWPGTQAGEGSDGAGAEGIHWPTGESSWP